MSNMKDLMIAISSANNIDITRECLKSIPHGPKVVVYDDSSTEPIEDLCSEFHVRLYKEDKPKGLTNLWNAAYRDFLSSGLKAVLISNNDVIFPRNSIEAMFKIFTIQKPIVLGPLSNKPGTGINQRIGNYLCNVNLDIHDSANVQLIQDMLMSSITNKFIYSDYINGFCFMVGKSVNQYRFDVGHLFSPRRINIGNEDWLCSQIKKGTGFQGKHCVICLVSFVFHYKGLTTRWCKKTSTKKGVNRENLWREV